MQLFTRFLNPPLTHKELLPTVKAAAKAPFHNKELYYVASGKAIGFHPVHILVQLTSNYSPDSVTKVASSLTGGSNKFASYASACHILGIILSVSIGLSVLLPSVCNKWSLIHRKQTGWCAHNDLEF